MLMLRAWYQDLVQDIRDYLSFSAFTGPGGCGILVSLHFGRFLSLYRFVRFFSFVRFQFFFRVLRIERHSTGTNSPVKV